MNTVLNTDTVIVEYKIEIVCCIRILLISIKFKDPLAQILFFFPINVFAINPRNDETIDFYVRDFQSFIMKLEYKLNIVVPPHQQISRVHPIIMNLNIFANVSTTNEIYSRYEMEFILDNYFIFYEY